MPILVDYEYQAKTLKKSGDLDSAKDIWLNSLAWQEYAAMRGDYIHVKGTVARLMKGRTVMALAPGDENIISARAKTIYDNLNKERVKRRLPRFEDNPPKIVDSINNLIVASMRSRGWSGWGSQFVADSDCVQKNILYLSSH
ncbi:hypothetical protein KO507_03340 [Gilvimarinus agarilyticus]|nr:hypothetical protein [Gilvimarinus agarilyticus]